MLVSDSSFLLCLFTIFLMKCYTDDLSCTTCGDCEHRSNSLCVFLRLAMFSLCICYSSHFSNSRNLIGCSFPLGTLQYVHCISYSIFSMFFRSKGTILCIFIIWFIRQDGLIWVSSWHLFFLREFVCVCVCVRACVRAWYTIFLLLGTSFFVAVTSRLVLSSFQIFWSKAMTTFKISFTLQYL